MGKSVDRSPLSIIFWWTRVRDPSSSGLARLPLYFERQVFARHSKRVASMIMDKNATAYMTMVGFKIRPQRGIPYSSILYGLL